jgi:NAD(P)-dependent dehydrogenase (short-subunit alcohol dehydrogenase family)
MVSSSRLLKHWRIAVLDDGSGIANVLVEELAASGYSALLAARGSADELPSGVNGFIFLGGLRSELTDLAAVGLNREAFSYARRLAGRLVSDEGCFITVQDTGGDFGLTGRAGVRAWSGGLSGLTKTAALEWPRALVKAIDLECAGDSAEDLGRRLAREILNGGPELEVGLHRDGRRTTLACASALLDAAPVHADTGDLVVLASGGARGVTAAALTALARARRHKIALLGTTPLLDEPSCLKGETREEGLKRELLLMARKKETAITPMELSRQASGILRAREVRRTLSALREAGSDASYYEVDIQNIESVQTAVNSIRARWGEIHAIIHGAGVLADKRMEQKTAEQFERVFSVKVEGFRNLLHATANDPLSLICVFSSMAARSGNAGQADYAMANEVLNKVAAAEAFRRGPGCVVKSVNWGPWDGGMVTPGLKEHFRELGVPLIPIEEGAQFFVREIGSGSGRGVEVVIGADPSRCTPATLKMHL